MKKFEEYKLNPDFKGKDTFAEVLATRLTKLENDVTSVDMTWAMFSDVEDAEEFATAATYESMTKDPYQWDADGWYEHSITEGHLFFEEATKGLFETETICEHTNTKALYVYSENKKVKKLKAVYRELNGNLVFCQSLRGDMDEVTIKQYDSKNRCTKQIFTMSNTTVIDAPTLFKNYVVDTKYNEEEKTSTSKIFINGTLAEIKETKWNEDFAEREFSVYTDVLTNMVYRIDKYNNEGNVTEIVSRYIEMDKNPIYSQLQY